MELLGYGGLFVSAGITLRQVLKNYLQLRAKLQYLSDQQVLTPQGLIDEIERGFLAQGSSNTASGSSFIRRNQIFIEGVLSSAKPISSILEPSLKLLYSLFYQKELYTRREFSKNANFPMLMPEKELTHTAQAPDFALADYETKALCHIQPKTYTNFQPALELLAIKIHFVKRGFFQSILRSLLEIARLILTVSYLKVKYLRKKGAYEGFADVEMGLKACALVTVFGDVIYDVHNKKLVMENPLFVLGDKHQLLSLVENKLVQKKIFIVAFLVPLLIGGGMFAKKLYEIMRVYLRKEREKLIDAMRQRMCDLAESKGMGDSVKCSICYNNLKNVILKPCLHMSLCHECLMRLQKRECPICKAHIVSTVELFIK